MHERNARPTEAKKHLSGFPLLAGEHPRMSGDNSMSLGYIHLEQEWGRDCDLYWSKIVI